MKILFLLDTFKISLFQMCIRKSNEEKLDVITQRYEEESIMLINDNPNNQNDANNINRIKNEKLIFHKFLKINN